MARSRRNPNRKENLKNYKNKHKTMSQNAALAGSMPPVRSIPIWPADAKIDVNGVEWEAIINTFSLLQNGLQAVQSVMSRNLVNGTMSMNFEKLNAQTLQYEQMTDEEQATHKAEYAETIRAFKEQIERQKQPPAKEEPVSTLVDATGEPIKSTVEEPEKPQAKVVDFATGTEVTE